MRWWLAVLVGAGAGAPAAWILSYAAALPFFLGAFFFALFGLMLGALVFRVAQPVRPYPAAHVWIGTTLLVLMVWGMALVKESRDFPHEMAELASDQTRNLEGRSVEQFRAELAGQIKQYLRDTYPPGGLIGYARWTLASGELKKEKVPLLSKAMTRHQTGVWWAMRVVLSVGLLAFGIGSQTLGLRFGGVSAQTETSLMSENTLRA